MSAMVDTRVMAGEVSLVADYYNRYPGELATFTLRFVPPDQAGASLQFVMPRVMKVESFELPQGIPVSLPSITEVENDLIVIVSLDTHFSAGKEYEIVIRARINTFSMDQYLITEASLILDNAQVAVSETLQVAVFGKGKYLQYLPEIYASDDFTSHLLMFFETFWKPVSQQIDQVENYFDPDLTPQVFIPWLASWVGLTVDESIPIERMRSLMKNARVLFQRRGTFDGLKTYLEIYTDGEVEIIERRARNFILAAESTLGVEIALGKKNQPNSVSINLRVPQEELSRTRFSDEMYTRKMNEVIRSLVPAHVFFDVNCTFISRAE